MEIKLDNVLKIYDERIISDYINCSFCHGFIAITGLSGCGKTTLLNMIVGDVIADSGSILIDDKNINSFKDKRFTELFAYNKVDGSNIDCLNVIDNLNVINNDKKQLENVLIRLNLLDKKKILCSKLSKGEQARVSIGRLLLMNQDCLILDEPTANLDKESADIVFLALKEESKKKLIILATHDIDFAAIYCDTVYELKDGKLNIIKENCDVQNSKHPIIKKSSSKKSIFGFCKLGFKRATHKKLPFIISSILLSFGCVLSFSSGCLFSVDKKETIRSIFSSSTNKSFICEDNRVTRDLYGKNSFSPKDIFIESGEKASIPLFPLQYDLSKNDGRNVINAIRLSDAINYNFNTNGFGEYKEYLKNYKDSDTEYIPGDISKKYYPILFPETLQGTLKKVLKRDIDIGGVVPFCFTNSKTVSFKPCFVLVGTYKSARTQDSKIENEPPVIIPDETVEDFFVNKGMSTFALNDAILNITNKYNNFILENNLPHKKIVANRYTLSNKNVQNISSFKLSHFKEGDILPMDESLLLYVGKLPTNRNEIMIPNREIYDLLSMTNIENDTKLFFEKYLENGYPMADPFSVKPHDSYYLPLFKVVGFYITLGPALRDESGSIIYNEDGTEKRTYMKREKLPIVLSDIEYDIARKFFIDEMRYDINTDISSDIKYLYSPKYLADNIDRVISNDIRNVGIDYQSYLKSINGQAILFTVLSAILIVFGLFVNLLYTMTIGRELNNDYLKIKYWGISKRRILIIPAITAISLTIIPSILGFCFGNFSLTLLSEYFFKVNNNVETGPVCNVGVGFMSLLIFIILCFLITLCFVSIFAYLKKRKKVL